MNANLRVQRSALLRDARAALRAGELAAALQHVEQTLRLDPGSAAARLLHARVLLQSAQPAEALRTLHAAQLYGCNTRRATSLRWRLLHARTLAQLGRRSDAITELRTLLELEPMHREAALRLASLTAAARPDIAIAPLQQILTAYPQDRTAKSLLARAFEAAGNPERAMRVRAQLNDQTIQAARLARRAGRLGEAHQRYESLLTRFADDADLHVEAAELAIEIGDDGAAVRRLEAALTINVDHTAAATRLAEQHMRCGRFEAAATIWYRLHRRHADRLDAIAGLIVCAIVLDRTAIAVRMRQRLAESVERTERRRLVGRMWRLALPGRVARDLILGRRSRGSGSLLDVMLSEAAHTLRHAAAEKPDHADLHFHHAVCLEELGEPAAAASSLDRALELNPKYTAASERRQKLAA
jgi:tetratricopeptide (TPR) repeat protein